MREHLTGAEASAIQIAWRHALREEGPTELDTVCGNIMRRLSNV